MGLFDSLGGALGSALGDKSGMMAVEALINQAGGIDGVIQKLNDAGLGETVNSWLGQGENKPISAAELQGALGNGLLQQAAGALGLDLSQISGLLAEHLPAAVDQASPNGTIDPGAIPGGGQ